MPFLFFFMVIEMFIKEGLIDSVPLDAQQISDQQKRDEYIQGILSKLRQKWAGHIQAQAVPPAFYIKL